MDLHVVSRKAANLIEKTAARRTAPRGENPPLIKGFA